MGLLRFLFQGADDLSYTGYLQTMFSVYSVL